MAPGFSVGRALLRVAHFVGPLLEGVSALFRRIAGGVRLGFNGVNTALLCVRALLAFDPYSVCLVFQGVGLLFELNLANGFRLRSTGGKEQGEKGGADQGDD
jgi:hypothetical protein